MLSYQLDHLPSGLTLLRIPMDSIQSVTALMLVNVGSRYEQPQQQGLAHLVEHLVFKGTRRYPSQRRLAVALDKVGAISNAFTSKEYTGFYVTAASRHLDLSLNILQQLVFEPLLKPEDIEREKPVIIEEIRMHQDAPDDHISNLFEQMVYQGSGLEHDISGSEQTVRSFDSDMVVNFMRQWYQLDQMVLVLAGDKQELESTDIVPKLEQIFKQTEMRASTGENASTAVSASSSNLVPSLDQASSPSSASSPISNQRLVVKQRQIAQAHFVLGWPAFKRDHPDRYALSLLSTVIGGNRSSRLFHEIREKRSLAYYIYSDVDHYHDGGIIGAVGGLNTDQAVAGIEATIDQFLQIGAGERLVTEQDLKMAQDYVLGKLVLSLESSRAVAQFFGFRQLLLSETETWQEVVKQIQAVTVADVNRLAQELFRPNETRLAVIGPFADEQKFAKLIALNHPSNDDSHNNNDDSSGDSDSNARSDSNEFENGAGE